MTFHQQEKNVPMLMMIFLMVGLMTVQKTQGFLISLHSSPVTAMGVKSTRRIISTTRRNLYEDEKNRHSLDSVEAAEPLPLSSKFQFITSCFCHCLLVCVTVLEKSWSSFQSNVFILCSFTKLQPSLQNKNITVADLQRLTEMKTRSLTMPIVILDALVPGQRLSFQRYV